MTSTPAYATVLQQNFGKTPPKASKQIWGYITHVNEQSIRVKGLSSLVSLGHLISAHLSSGRLLTGEVIALENDITIAMMHSQPDGLRIGQKVFVTREQSPCPSDDWIGQVLNHAGQSIDGDHLQAGGQPAELKASPPDAILRKMMGPQLSTGVAAIDTFLPLCQGQRLGLFAGSGVGKSTLLAALAKTNSADINIIALIGERGREVRAFVEKTLGTEGMKKSIVFVATSNELSALKLRTALLAMATAEFFRDQGQQVLFLFDSITRYAEAHRDVALTAGEVPSLRAYPPSTFRALASLCERAGPGVNGSGDITGVFSVLVAGSNMEEPIADMVRGILDGHVILDREIAERGRYPAIDIRRSVSRSLPDAVSEDQHALLMDARAHITNYEESRSLIQAGLYVEGSDPELDKAIAVYPGLDTFVSEIVTPNIEASFEKLKTLLHPLSDMASTPEREGDSHEHLNS